MSSKQGGSVAPKERINISYKPATGGVKESVELPLKLLVLGDFTQQLDDRIIEQRKPINVSSENFDDVMKDCGMSLNFSVKNHMVEGSEQDLDVSIKIESIKDFDPDNVINAVPELKKILKLRESLQALKGPLGNVPQMRRTIQEMLTDQEKRQKLMSELEIKK